MSKGLWRVVEKWVTIKIGVEIRCCLSFFLMLFYYCIYRIVLGSFQADILHIAEMMAAAYLFGWIQALLRADFDQMDSLGFKEWAVVLLSGIVYGSVAWLCSWFGSSAAVVLFMVYMAGCALSTVLICHIKRAIDAKLLNDDLRAFQQRNADAEEEKA